MSADRLSDKITTYEELANAKTDMKLTESKQAKHAKDVQAPRPPRSPTASHPRSCAAPAASVLAGRFSTAGMLCGRRWTRRARRPRPSGPSCSRSGRRRRRSPSRNRRASDPPDTWCFLPWHVSPASPHTPLFSCSTGRFLLDERAGGRVPSRLRAEAHLRQSAHVRPTRAGSAAASSP